MKNQQSAKCRWTRVLSARRIDSRLMVRRLADETGQATVEYALVMLGAAAVAGMLLAWAVGSGLIGDLMTTIVNSVISDATPVA